MTIHTAAGTTVWIGSTSGVASVDSTGFNAKSYSAIGELTTIGDIGAIYNVVKHMPVGNRTVVKVKGSVDQGKLALDMAADPADPGQIILKTAVGGDFSWAIKVVEQDGTTTYFLVQVVSFVKKIAGVDSVVVMHADLEIVSNLF